MAVRISLEIGHEAALRTKKTPEGFTHDWEVFVRGCDGAEISYYVEKVVFYLHETFPKPKRVVKEPPYTVKESGYAGFNLPIDIYLKNSGEPKKLRFNYDLHLQQAGLPIQKTQKEKHVFGNPPDDFKARLLKGGGTISSSSNSLEISDSRPSYDNEKNQMTSKPKLAGCEIKKQKFKPEGPQTCFQKVFGSPIFTTSNKTVVIDQNKQQGAWNNKDQKNTQKSDKVSSDKVRTHKDGSHKDSHKDKFKGDSDKHKRDEKRKEKVKDRERSKDKSAKKERSPRPKSSSPRRVSPKRSITPLRLSPAPPKHREANNKHDKEKRDKSDDKKAKKEKRKEHKDNKHGGDDEHPKFRPEIVKKEVPKIKIEAPSSPPLPPPPPKVPERKEKSKEKSSSIKDPAKDEKSFSEKHRLKKSKDKDKEKRSKKEERPYNNKQDKKDSLHVKQESVPNPPPKKEKIYLGTNVVTNADEDSSSSSNSSSDSSAERRPPPKEVVKAKEERNSKPKKDKGYQDGGIKCKRKSNLGDADVPPEKVHRDHGNLNNNSDADEAPPRSIKEEEDYISVLRDLQHKIMGLKDNSDLQKVVQLIAETGRYEVSAHTFDFDLCLLDRSTVQQLQEFFASES